MLSLTLIYFLISSAVLLLLTTLYLFEVRAGERIVLGKLRMHLDRGLEIFLRWLKCLLRRMSRFMARTVLSYGVYQLLESIVARLIRIEQRAERLIRHHRPITAEKRNRNHLDEVAEHKDAVALTEKEKQQMRDS